MDIYFLPAINERTLMKANNRRLIRDQGWLFHGKDLRYMPGDSQKIGCIKLEVAICK